MPQCTTEPGNKSGLFYSHAGLQDVRLLVVLTKLSTERYSYNSRQIYERTIVTGTTDRK